MSRSSFRGIGVASSLVDKRSFQAGYTAKTKLATAAELEEIAEQEDEHVDARRQEKVVRAFVQDLGDHNSPFRDEQYELQVRKILGLGALPFHWIRLSWKLRKLPHSTLATVA